MRIGIFGGTFDPPHIGHLIVVQDACIALGLDRVLLIPAALPPHKRDRSTTSPELRLAMLRAAVSDDPRFEVSEMELRRDGPSFTVETLRQLREEHPGDELVLLIGSDQYREFDTWRESEAILQLATLGVLARDGDAPAEGDIAFVPVPVTRIDLSSTQIRARVREGHPIRYLVPAAVEALIREAGLYAGGPEAAGADAGR